MIVGNDRGHWWAYCQRCKEGGRMDKEHVLLGGHGEAVESQSRAELPGDLKQVLGSGYEAAIGGFLASKGMMFPYLPQLWYSESARRVCVQDERGSWHGRDLTGRSNAKWLHYSVPALALAPCGFTTVDCVVTEDVFSMFKVAYAMRGTYVNVVSTMGAGCGDRAALALKSWPNIVWAYDGDKAGDDGFTQARKKMRPFVRKQYRARPPEGLDPKDMDIIDIRSMIERRLQ